MQCPNQVRAGTARVAIAALCALWAGPAGAQTAAEEFAAPTYFARLEQVAARISLDMGESHKCYLMSGYVASTLQVPNQDVQRANRLVYAQIADAYNVRIRNLMAAGQAIPSEYVWVGEAMSAARVGAPVVEQPGGVAFRDRYLRDEQAGRALTQSCASAFVTAAGDQWSYFQRRAAILSVENSNAQP